MLKMMFCFTVLSLFFCGCAGIPEAADNSGSAQSAAYDAIASMDRALAGEPMVPPSGESASRAAPGVPASAFAPEEKRQQEGVSAAGDKPSWVDSPDTVFSRQRYVSAVGFGADRLQAERSALANLTGVFGQSVQAELKTVSVYTEAVRSGAIQITEDKSVQDAVTTSIEMDTLIGAEIADVWFDNKNTYYAAAVMEKEKSAVLYAGLIKSNERIIDSLVSIADTDKNTLDGYSRFALAASIADANHVYANVLAFVGNTAGTNPGTMKRGEDYRIEAAEIARNIPIAVSVEGDRAGRIRNAFSRSLSGAGFRVGGTGSRYALKANLAMTLANLPNQPNVFFRYLVDVELIDTEEDAVLFPFSFNGREGQVNQAEAEERVLRTAENRIASEYGNSLRDYLSLFLPK